MGKLIPLVGAAVVALVVGLGAGWYLGSSRAPAAPATHAAEATPPPAFTYSIPSKVVNLADPGGRRYLKVSIVLTVPESAAEAAKRKAPPTPEEQKKFETDFGTLYGPQVNDLLTNILTSKRTDDLMSPDGKDRLREEIRTKLNAILPKSQQVAQVYLTDFIIQ